MMPTINVDAMKIRAFDKAKYGFEGMEHVPYGQLEHPRFGLVDLIEIRVGYVVESAINGFLNSPSGVTATFLPNNAAFHKDNEWSIKLTRYDATGEHTFNIFQRQQRAAAQRHYFGPPIHRMCLVTFRNPRGEEVARWWGYGTSRAELAKRSYTDRVILTLQARAEREFKQLQGSGWTGDLAGSNIGKYRHRRVIVDFGFDCGWPRDIG